MVAVPAVERVEASREFKCRNYLKVGKQVPLLPRTLPHSLVEGDSGSVHGRPVALGLNVYQSRFSSGFRFTPKNTLMDCKASETSGVSVGPYAPPPHQPNVGAELVSCPVTFETLPDL